MWWRRWSLASSIAFRWILDSCVWQSVPYLIHFHLPRDRIHAYWQFRILILFHWHFACLKCLWVKPSNLQRYRMLSFSKFHRSCAWMFSLDQVFWISSMLDNALSIDFDLRLMAHARSRIRTRKCSWCCSAERTRQLTLSLLDSHCCPVWRSWTHHWSFPLLWWHQCVSWTCLSAAHAFSLLLSIRRTALAPSSVVHTRSSEQRYAARLRLQGK